ncbi:MAG TPA: ATP-binding protein [Longimicrobiales bacterium]|nr:ATP-binding protein [Longimicrobiales bacterium]
MSIRVILAAACVGAYALVFLELYEVSGIEAVYASAALVLAVAWLLGFWGGIATAILSFPINAVLLSALGEPGWALVTQAGAVQAAVLVLVLGAIIGGLRDIGERMKREMEIRILAEAKQRESEERYRIVAEGASEAIFTLDDEARIVYANPAAERIFGHSIDDMHGERFEVLVAPHARGARLERILSAGGQNGQRVFETSGLHVDGREIPLEVSFGEYRLNGENSHIGIIRDITDRKQTEAALKDAKEAAERANTAKSEFLSRMSHELRTPLNGILGFGQLLEMEPLDEEQKESVEQILKAGRHLLGLINEVLDIARIEAGRLALSLEPTPLGEVLQESVELVRPIAAQKMISINYDAAAMGESHVIADRQRLKQVMLNLLSNGVKYNVEGGSVTIECTPRESGDVLTLAVRDSGRGIPEDKLKDLFTPFERLDADKTGVEGTGLGLALSKRLVEAMGGKMTVESTVGTGSTFAITLPAARDPVEVFARTTEVTMIPEADAPEPAAEVREEHTVLYIEDNISNFKLIQRVLSYRPGVGLLAAMQGHLGLELAREHCPDLILLDLHLPDMHGSDVLKELREDPETRDIPVVVVSADATPGQVQRLLAAGARDYLTKPLNVQQFLEVLDETLAEQAKKAVDAT